MKHLKAVLSLVLLCVVAMPLSAMRVKRFTLEQIRDLSGSVVVGEVIGSSTRIADRGETVWTDYELRVSETLAGAPKGAIHIVSIAGGEAMGLSVSHPGVPHLEVGGRYLLFLEHTNKFPTPIMGVGQGLFRINDVTINGVSHRVLLSADGEPLEMNAEGRLGRGRFARVENGSLLDQPREEVERQSAQRVDIIARNADGSPATLGTEVQSQTVRARGTFATVDDVRRFVQQTPAGSRQ